MKQLDLYIIERLKLNKDSNFDKSDLTDEILTITLLEDNKDVKNVIEHWINDNYVNDIKVYMLYTTNTNEHLKKIINKINTKIGTRRADDFVELMNRSFPKDPSTWEKFCQYGNEDISVYQSTSQSWPALYFVSYTDEYYRYDILIVRDRTIDDL